MGNGTDVTLAGDWAKPVNTLVEKISDATGSLLGPWQVKRMARAEAEASKTKALADIEITELQQRAMYRLMQEETIKQENIEAIASKSFESINDDAKPEDMENDWIANFFDKCKFISDDEMQELWAKILSGEANKPGTFSKRTIELMAQLDKKDAELFRNLCSFCWMFGSDVTAIVLKYDDDIYTNEGINFSTLSHLDDLGLIKFATVAGYQKTGFQKYGTFLYYGTPVNVEFRADSANNLEIGQVMLTKIGAELAPVSNPSRNDAYFDYVLEQWHKKGLTLSMPLVQNR